MHRKEVVVKGTILAGLFYVFCAVSGCFAGFGICRVESTRETEPIEQNISTEDKQIFQELLSNTPKEELLLKLASLSTNILEIILLV